MSDGPITHNMFSVTKGPKVPSDTDLVFSETDLLLNRNHSKKYIPFVIGDFWLEYKGKKLQNLIEIFNNATAVMCASKFIKQYLDKRLSNKANTFVLPGGLWGTDHVQYKVCPDRFTKKETYEIGERPIISMCMSLLGKQKYEGISIFLDATKDILRSYNAKVVCYGRSFGNQDSIKYWQSLCDFEYVQWRRKENFTEGYGDQEWPKFLTTSDIFVHPSLWDAWGCAVADAMYSAVPTIVFSGTGSEEVGFTTIKPPPNDVGEIRDAIFDLLSSERLRMVAGQAHNKEAIENNEVYRGNFAKELIRFV